MPHKHHHRPSPRAPRRRRRIAVAVLATAAALAAGGIAGPAAAGAAPLFRCTDAGGTPLFSDRPCPPGSRNAGRLPRPDGGSFVGGGLTDADRAQLQRIDQRRSAGGPWIGGLVDPAAQKRCEAARARLEAHRIRARRPHSGSLLARGRALSDAVFRLCR